MSQLKNEIELYWNQVAREYNEFPKKKFKPKVNEGNEKWKKILCDAFGDDPETILDCGTGPGTIAMMLAESGYNMTGVDLSENMLSYARQNAKSAGLSIAFKQGDLESIPFPDNAFDGAVSRHVLWTTLHPEVVLKEWYRILKPGGRLVYVDGNWYRNEGTMKRKIWMILSMITVMITEFRDPRYHDIDSRAKAELWSMKTKRPEYDVDLLKKVGFVNIAVRQSIEKQVSTKMEILKEGYWGPIFLVSADKPDPAKTGVDSN